MSDYEPSPAEIEAALESWFPDAKMGWKGNPNFANRAFWRQTMRAALIAANRSRVLQAPIVYVDTVRRIEPAPPVKDGDDKPGLMTLTHDVATAIRPDAGHEHQY